MDRAPGRLFKFLQMMLLIGLLAWVSPALSQDCQSGFLSIDCGSAEDYVDPITGIRWTPDAAYISTGTVVQDLALPDVSYPDNRAQLTSLRHFQTKRNKYCYVLPVKLQTSYLIRTTFYPGSLNNTSFAFDLYLNNTMWASYSFSSGQAVYLVQYIEGVFYSIGTELNFCLVPTGAGTNGEAFLSALEIRELASGMYSKTEQGNFLLYSLSRTNYGTAKNGSSTRAVRFPDDGYDRFWLTESFNATVISKTHIRSSPANAPDRPPRLVMEDAITYGYDYLTFIYTYNFLFGSEFYVSLYVQEVDGNQRASNVRGMRIYFNNKYISVLNSSNEPVEFTIPTQFVPDKYLNISFYEASWSNNLPPICNAAEIYSVQAVNFSTTAIEDVIALVALQRRLNLTDWTGDPCLPMSHNWLSCSSDSTPRVTSLLLASMGITGPIPVEISNLTALTDIQLQNNNFTGEIPGFLAELPRLTHLNLDNNTLSGSVPSNLVTKLGSNFTARNNPGLICNVPACGFAPSICNDPACGVAPSTPSTPPTPPTPSTPSTPSSNSKAYIGAAVGGTIGGLVLLSILACMRWFLCTRKRRTRSSTIRSIFKAEKRSSLSSPLGQNNSSGNSLGRQALLGSISALSLQEVSDATKNFSRKLGEGSFGPVYYGKLPDGQEVAVKVKSGDSRQGFTEFFSEVSLLSRIHHRNLVSLVGYCEEGNQQMLIYKFVPNGTLREHLYGDRAIPPLSWRTRLDAALNSARGLEYLHTDCKPPIIHRDVKSSNILLNENLVAKVADFGISKQAPEGVFAGVDTLHRGTPVYLDPEYFITQRLTQKSDVYSFGVVLLEIVSGRHPHVRELPDGTTGTLIQWVKKSVQEEKILDFVDPTLKGQFNYESMMKVISLALESVSLVTTERPDMSQVIRAINDATNLQISGSKISSEEFDLHAKTKLPEKHEPFEADFTAGSLPEFEVAHQNEGR